jgi:hypothetical protein
MLGLSHPSLWFGKFPGEAPRATGRSAPRQPASVFCASLSGTPVVHAGQDSASRVYHGPGKWLELGKKVGDPPWTRTMNPEIKSLLEVPAALTT